MEAVKAVLVFPRQRKRNPDVNRPPKQAVTITIDDILARADMSLSEAALSLGISVTTLKKACRLLGVVKWPYTRSGTSYSKSLSKRRKIQAKSQAKSSCESPVSVEVEDPLSFLDMTLPFWDAGLWNVDTALPEVPAEGCDLWYLGCGPTCCCYLVP
jgi:hypothetical protein